MYCEGVLAAVLSLSRRFPKSPYGISFKSMVVVITSIVAVPYCHSISGRGARA
jgi:hypothetical protein